MCRESDGVDREETDILSEEFRNCLINPHVPIHMQ